MNTLTRGTLAMLAATLLVPIASQGADAPVAKAKKADVQCEPSAQTRIHRPKAEGCKGATPTRTYTKDELDSTGEFNAADALRRLDPRIR